MFFVCMAPDRCPLVVFCPENCQTSVASFLEIHHLCCRKIESTVPDPSNHQICNIKLTQMINSKTKEPSGICTID